MWLSVWEDQLRAWRCGVLHTPEPAIRICHMAPGSHLPTVLCLAPTQEWPAAQDLRAGAQSLLPQTSLGRPVDLAACLAWGGLRLTQI